MGGGLLRRWRAGGHTVTVFDPAPGVESVASLEALVHSLPSPRYLWLMVPAEKVSDIISKLTHQLDSGDVVIDGGNSNYKDSQRHAQKLVKRGIRFVDVGVSGGVAGEERGYALMVGGEASDIAGLSNIFSALEAPGATAHVGPAGAGHFVKMVHNAIEYGMMQAIGEGFDLLKNGPIPNLDVAQVATLWSHGTIVRSFLMELAARALVSDSNLSDIASYVDDSGEGRWATEAAVESAVPFWVNTAALYARFDSRQSDLFSAKLIAALRREFGGHAVKPTSQE